VIEVKARGLVFDVHEGGPEDGEPVLLLHGFPQDSREFDLILPRLHAAGLRTYALDQRGCSPGARPSDVAAYAMTSVTLDAIAVLDALGIEKAHVVGHDWGAQVGWQLAARHADRVRTLTAISVPHPRALMLALALRLMLRPLGMRAEQYVAAMREPGRLTGGLNWYRAFSRAQVVKLGPVTVPTTFVWSDADGVVGRTAVLRTRDWVQADYQLVVMRGVSHWVPEQAPNELADAVLARIGV
jgi:pimeloyl-ACP methyl ester carboxylesterase